MDDRDIEDLEEELWRLRSIEIDFDQVKQELNSMRAENIVLKEQVDKHKEHQEAKDKLIKRVEDHYEEVSKKLQMSENAMVNMTKERDWLLKKLEAMEQSEHMYSTYGFEIPEKEEPKTPGWRLRR